MWIDLISRKKLHAFRQEGWTSLYVKNQTPLGRKREMDFAFQVNRNRAHSTVCHYAADRYTSAYIELVSSVGGCTRRTDCSNVKRSLVVLAPSICKRDITK